MEASLTTIGLIQIGEVVWERRPSKQYHLVAGALRPKPAPATSAASLAYLPHSAGLLQAYCRRYAAEPQSLRFLLPLYKRIPIALAVEHLMDADVAGFSIYVWNVRFSLAIARELKRRRPQVTVIMGGPQVPDDAGQFLQANPFVDLVCHGEGERTFLEVIERYRSGRRWEGVAGISYLAADGGLIANPRRPRMPELDQIPSPMLDGTYEELMRSVPGQQWLATWETNRGCPFACSFCDWGSATASKISRYSDERLFQEIEWLAEHGLHHLFVCDANFGMLSRDVEIAQRIADTYVRHGIYAAISVQNTKNRTDRSEKIQRIFKESKVISFGASISLQSVDSSVLKAIQRDNISLKAFDQLQKHYARQGLDTYSDLIIGLPGESYRSFTQGVGAVIFNGQLNRVAFYECSVLPNAPMAQPEYRKAFQMETVPVKLVHAHEPLQHDNCGEPEFIDIVVSTSTMSREDWVRARVFADLVELLFFDRLLHVPLVLLGSGLGVDYTRMFEAFLQADPAGFPVTAAARGIFEEHARSMLNGREQYLASQEWLNLWWPADQYSLITLARGERLEAFYDEARGILRRCVADAGLGQAALLIDDAVRLNQAMFALPFLLCDDEVETTYPVADAYQALLTGAQPCFRQRRSLCRVDRSETIWMSWNDWCEDLVRRVFLRKNYLYPIHPLDDRTMPAHYRDDALVESLSSEIGR